MSDCSTFGTTTEHAEDAGLVSSRMLFGITAVFLLLLTTNRFDADVYAFMFSVIVLAGVMYFE